MYTIKMLWAAGCAFLYSIPVTSLSRIICQKLIDAHHLTIIDVWISIHA